jgi:hypothetical protein
MDELFQEMQETANDDIELFGRAYDVTKEGALEYVKNGVKTVLTEAAADEVLTTAAVATLFYAVAMLFPNLFAGGTTCACGDMPKDWTSNPHRVAQKPDGWKGVGPNDLDWTNRPGAFQDAIDKAFELTGEPRENFEVTKWANDQYAKSHPVEWTAPGGAEVNIDWPFAATAGPPVPHVGWQTRGKRPSGAKRGHILLFEVPYFRIGK